MTVCLCDCFIHLLVSLLTHARTQQNCIQKSFLTKSRICFPLSFYLSHSMDHSLTYKDKFSPFCLLHSLTLSTIFGSFLLSFTAASFSHVHFHLYLFHLFPSHSVACMGNSRNQNQVVYSFPQEDERAREREREREKRNITHMHRGREKRNEYETKEKETEENSRECVERERPQYNYVCVVLLYTKFYLSQLIGTSS